MTKGVKENLIGRVFHKLIVLERAPNFEGKSDSRSQYLCRCICGREELVVGRNLTRSDKKCCRNCSVQHNVGTPLKDARAEIKELKKLLAEKNKNG